MGCLFSCFRVRDDPPVSQPIMSMETLDSLASSSLWSVLPPEAVDHDQSEGNDEISGATGSPGSDEGLMAEAKFLKACGTLPQTPVEIRSTKKLNDSQPQSGNMEATFHSWLPNTTTTEKALEKQPDEFLPPIKLFEEWEENKSDSAPHSPNSYTAGKSTDTTSSSDGCEVIDPVKDSSTSYTPMAASTQIKNKSVRFESESDDSSSSSSRGDAEKITDQNLNTCDQNAPKPSPYPTPLKLTNDMQTPGTAFPSYVKSGKNPRIRFQYVYSGVDPEIFSRLEPPIEECVEDAEKETPQSQIHWNNGNGIPNTTNKYKEDQKVSWHATPFEERLEKALSDDKKKQIGQTLPIQF